MKERKPEDDRPSKRIRAIEMLSVHCWRRLKRIPVRSSPVPSAGLIKRKPVKQTPRTDTNSRFNSKDDYFRLFYRYYLTTHYTF
mmetsp:Transcript_111297/g.227904  ORF Transcript_111297/g.227904 Transcript_111297/m.227904 type:complete len:84 (+) Transcript_111297:343-594(+)